MHAHPSLASLAALVLLVTSGCSRREVQQDPPLVVGMELAYRPFEMTDERGEPTGISVDLARALGESLGREVDIRNLPFDGLIPALRTGAIDLVISSMTATEERARSIDFSEPYVWTGLAILASEKDGVRSLADLNQAGKTVAVKQGTTGQQFARDALPLATVRVFDDENACVLEVLQGKADAFLYDQMSVYRHAQRHPGLLRPLLDPVRREAWAVGLRKGNTELLDQVNAFLGAYRGQGGFDRLAEKYLDGMKDDFAALGYPFIFDPPGD